MFPTYFEKTKTWLASKLTFESLLWLIVFGTAWGSLLLERQDLNNTKARMDTPLLMNTIMTFCGSASKLYTVCPTTDSRRGEGAQDIETIKTRIQVERLSTCTQLMEEASRRNITARVAFGNKTMEMTITNETMDKLLSMNKEEIT